MSSWRDYIDLSVLLPATGWVVASFVALHSLWLAKDENKTRSIIVFGMYSFVTVAIAFWYDYEDTQSLRSSRDVDRNIKTLLALSGLPSANTSQGLNQLITRNLQPRQIIPTQEEVLARSLEVFKDITPKRIAITCLPLPTSDTWGIREAISRAFARNGIAIQFEYQTTSSPQETGLMFTMSDPRNPSEFALKLKDAFELAGIRDIQFVQIGSDVSSQLDFTIFIGPAAIK